MNTLTRTIMMCMLILGVTACSEQKEAKTLTADIEVSISTNPHWGTLTFDIQTITDSTVISNVVINRGNCRLPAGTASELSRNVSLKFGETYTGYSNNCTVDSVKEIEVTSSAGTFVYTF
ncbi:Lipoprotein [Vibrio crassostreae]|nr:Lipoprotein [Vibrio crassostreae]CAK2837855.1 Lipoprotein [Vibrio crassostreae]CAK2865682.1 Lipoprotein [Vibrio crassostreae]